MIWKRLFGSNDATPEMSGESHVEEDLFEADRQLEAAIDWLDSSTLALCERGVGQQATWNADLANGKIIFSSEGKQDLAFACQAVGTHNPVKQTWHWAWDHPSIPSNISGAAEAVRDFGATHGLEAFTTRQIVAGEPDAWQFAGLAGLLTNACGVYRCPGDVVVYLTLYELN